MKETEKNIHERREESASALQNTKRVQPRRNRERETAFINYAHRGASAYAPENTMAAFRLGLALGANGIETDIRRTKDGVLVLFHDESLLRLTGADRRIAELTYAELQDYPIPSPDGTVTDTVPTLEAFLTFAKDIEAVLALELKAENVEADVLKAIAAFGLTERCFVTSFSMEYLSNVKALRPHQRVGLLTDTVNEGVINELKRIGAEQICPKAAVLTPALVRDLHGEGFNVRAWGVKDEALMRHALGCGVDGMTVNFPDKLRF